MHIKSDNIEIMGGTEASEAINELFNSFLGRYQEGLETKIKGSGYIFERVDLLEYHLHKISMTRRSSYINSPEWLKNKRARINPKNTRDNEYIKYEINTALHDQNIVRNPQRISKLEPFIYYYNWKDIEFPSHSKDWRKFEQNNKAIALNILYVPYNTMQIKPAYISKNNRKRDNQVNLLMIADDSNNRHYLAIKKISGLLRGIISNHNGDFYCLNCFHSYTTKKKLKKHERICRDHDFCYIKKPDEDKKILKYNPEEKSIKVPHIFYVDLQCLLEIKDTCQNNPEKSYAEKKAIHKPSGYSLVICCSYNKSKNERKYYRGEEGMEMLTKDLREQAMK